MCARRTISLDDLGRLSIRILGLLVFSGLFLLAAQTSAFSQTDDGTRLEEVVVEADRQGSLVQPSARFSRSQLNQVPGGTNFVGISKGSGKIDTLFDAMKGEPGVMVQEFFGNNDQPRLNIRGSGIQSNPQSRGVLLLKDGLPLNLSDGEYVIGSLAPRTADHMQVYRGANAIRYGGTTLGGAINLVSPTGRSASGNYLELAGGSYDQRLLQFSRGQVLGNGFDYYVTGIANRSDGFRRQNNNSERETISMNFGHKTKGHEMRFYLDYSNLDFEIPGPLTQAQLDEDPRQVNRGINKPGGPFGPHVVRDEPWRESEMLRLAMRSASIDPNGSWQGGIAYKHYDDQFGSPTTVRNSLSDDISFNLRRVSDLTASDAELEFGLRGIAGQMEREYFANERGDVGKRYASNDLTSANVVGFSEYQHPFTENLTGLASVQAIYALRDIEEAFPTPSNRPRYIAPKDTYKTMKTTSAVEQRRTYQGYNLRIGGNYQLQKNTRLFANLSQSYEPPTFLDLLSPSGANPNKGPNLIGAAPLDAQNSVTLEVGSRGASRGMAGLERIDWDLASYYTVTEDELITDQAFTGGIGTTGNYSDETNKFGVELGLGSTVASDLYASGDALDWDLTYEYSDFHFDGGEFSGNQIAGIPENRIQSKLLYRKGGFQIGPNVLWVPDETPTDMANTIYQESYTLLGAKASYQPTESNWSVYLEGQNLTDETYASSYLIREKVSNPPPGPAGPEDVTTFIPGTGRTVTAGVSIVF